MKDRQEKYNLPENWRLVKLSDIAYINMGQSPPSNTYNYDNIGLPFFQGKAEFGELYPTINKYCSTPIKIAETDDILISVRAPIGPTNLAPGKCCIGRGLASIKPFGNISHLYILWYLRSVESNVANLGTGSVFKAISKNILENILIPIAPIQEINRIILTLEELFSKMEKSKEQLKISVSKLETYRKLVLNRAFEGKLTSDWRNSKMYNLTGSEKKHYKDISLINNMLRKELPSLKELPKYWGWVRLRNISLGIDYGYSGKSTNKIVGPKFLRITDIQHNNVNWDSVPYCKISDKRKTKYLLKDGDLLFARTGATVGKSYLVTSVPDESIFASYLIRVILAENINHIYIYYFFQSELYWKQIVKNKAGVAQPNVNGTKLSSLVIPFTSKKEQDQVVKILDNIMSICDNMELSIRKSLFSIELTKQSILNKAFEGQLMEQNFEDEPVELLLKRIGNEMEKYLITLRELQNNTPKIRAMPEKAKSILEILNENTEPISSKRLWLSSDKKDDIEEFYAELKKYIESGEVIELPRIGKESFLKLTNKNENR